MFNVISKKYIESLNKSAEYLANLKYPPYNCFVDEEGNTNIELATSGFNKSDLKVKIKKNKLVVAGSLPETQKAIKDAMHKGISSKDFEVKFDLMYNSSIGNVKYVDGVLSIVVKKPEAQETELEIN